MTIKNFHDFNHGNNFRVILHSIVESTRKAPSQPALSLVEIPALSTVEMSLPNGYICQIPKLLSQRQKPLRFTAKNVSKLFCHFHRHRATPMFQITDIFAGDAKQLAEIALRHVFMAP